MDQDNKIYLSREFLLDKYYSTTEFLTEPEMRFIIKTSPMLSKCVDKMFIRNALKNIDHADINKLELKIAENIISRFDQVRRAVRESRKLYKQSKNDVIKERIFQFEQKQEFEVAREIAREELRKHKIRPVQIGKSQSAVKLRPFNFASKKGCVPLNQYHPASGLFVKDCNEQCNDDLVAFCLLSSTTMRRTISKRSEHRASIERVLSVLYRWSSSIQEDWKPGRLIFLKRQLARSVK